MRACEIWSHDEYLNHAVMELFMAELDRRVGMGGETCADFEDFLLAAFQAIEDEDNTTKAQIYIKQALDMIDY